jgi:hypothetical protein
MAALKLQEKITGLLVFYFHTLCVLAAGGRRSSD